MRADCGSYVVTTYKTTRLHNTKKRKIREKTKGKKKGERKEGKTKLLYA